ncbi:MAG: Gfo/Idh/MocA family protein [Hyphomicrobiales bacterium]
MSKTAILVLGAGAMAAQHVKHFRADPRAEIVACADIDAGRARGFAAKHGIGKAFGSLDDALSWGKFEAAANVTPDSAHHSTTMKLVAAGKHVLCEKPLAESFGLADEMARAAGKAGIVNMVNLSYRNVAALQAAQRMIAAGEIGEVRHVEASYRQSWLVGNHWGDWRSDPKWLWRLSGQHGSKGVLGDIGIHIVDFACHAVGMMPVSLQARLKTFHKAPDHKIGGYPLDANDSATMAVEFGNGALGVIHASRFMTGYGNVLKLDVFGTEGAIEIVHGLDWTEIRMCSGEDVHTQAWRRVIAEPVETLYRIFVTAVREGGKAEPDFRRGADLQKILDLCFSAEAAASAPVGP